MYGIFKDLEFSAQTFLGITAGLDPIQKCTGPMKIKQSIDNKFLVLISKSSNDARALNV